MDDWTPHRRDDGELLGWIHPAGDDEWVAVDVLGRTISAGPIEWLDAEAALEEHGLSWLADPWMLDREAERPLRVRMVEVTPDRDGSPGRIVVKIDDYGDMTRTAAQQFVLPWPVPERLRAPQPGDPDGFTL
ncbi:hypothetical protein [Microbacterium sp. TWP3-1-2b2]|uniref:hypothetical protein n=1 Tax=Microbacterium sp. TWP3-1-2b2 TaxID=2804651 RepID=UPI003CEB8286